MALRKILPRQGKGTTHAYRVQGLGLFLVVMFLTAFGQAADSERGIDWSEDATAGDILTGNLVAAAANDETAQDTPAQVTPAAEAKTPDEDVVPSPVTLASEIRQLAETNPSILASKSQLKASKWAARQAYSSFLPTLALSNDHGYEVTDSPAAKPLYLGMDTVDLTLTQPLFAGFRNLANQRSANLQEDVASLSLEKTQQAILLQGITSYLNVLRQYQSLELIKDQEDTLARQLRMEQARVSKGSGIKVDVLTARTRVQRARAQHARFAGGLQVAMNSYAEVFDRLPNVSVMETPTLPMDRLPKSLEEGTRRGLRFNPAALIANRNTRISTQNLRMKRADFLPTLNLETKWSRKEDAVGLEGMKREQTFKLKTSWQMFSGFSSTAGLGKARAELSAARYNRTATRRSVIRQVRTAWRQLQTATTRAGYLDQASKTAFQVFQAREKLRDAGKEEAIEVLNAENEARSAQINFIQANIDRQIAFYTLLQAMGELDLNVL